MKKVDDGLLVICAIIFIVVIYFSEKVIGEHTHTILIGLLFGYIVQLKSKLNEKENE